MVKEVIRNHSIRDGGDAPGLFGLQGTAMELRGKDLSTPAIGGKAGIKQTSPAPKPAGALLHAAAQETAALREQRSGSWLNRLFSSEDPSLKAWHAYTDKIESALKQGPLDRAAWNALIDAAPRTAGTPLLELKNALKLQDSGDLSLALLQTAERYAGDHHYPQLTSGLLAAAEQHPSTKGRVEELRTVLSGGGSLLQQLRYQGPQLLSELFSPLSLLSFGLMAWSARAASVAVLARASRYNLSTWALSEGAALAVEVPVLTMSRRLGMQLVYGGQDLFSMDSIKQELKASYAPFALLRGANNAFLFAGPSLQRALARRGVDTAIRQPLLKTAQFATEVSAVLAGHGVNAALGLENPMPLSQSALMSAVMTVAHMRGMGWVLHKLSKTGGVSKLWMYHRNRLAQAGLFQGLSLPRTSEYAWAGIPGRRHESIADALVWRASDESDHSGNKVTPKVIPASGNPETISVKAKPIPTGARAEVFRILLMAGSKNEHDKQYIAASGVSHLRKHLILLKESELTHTLQSVKKVLETADEAQVEACLEVLAFVHTKVILRLQVEAFPLLLRVLSGKHAKKFGERAFELIREGFDQYKEEQTIEAMKYLEEIIADPSGAVAREYFDLMLRKLPKNELRMLSELLVSFMVEKPLHEQIALAEYVEHHWFFLSRTNRDKVITRISNELNRAISGPRPFPEVPAELLRRLKEANGLRGSEALPDDGFSTTSFGSKDNLLKLGEIRKRLEGAGLIVKSDIYELRGTADKEIPTERPATGPAAVEAASRWSTKPSPPPAGAPWKRSQSPKRSDDVETTAMIRDLPSNESIVNRAKFLSVKPEIATVQDLTEISLSIMQHTMKNQPCGELMQALRAIETGHRDADLRHEAKAIREDYEPVVFREDS